MSRKNTGSREVKAELPEMPGRAASRQKTAVAINAIRRARKTVPSIPDERLEEYRKEGRK